jgi:hypothetical protein
MIEHLETCFEKAYNLDSKISQDIKDMQGMTGEMTRHFYNNLLTLKDARYLEIGTWMGSSSCAAMYKNKAHVVLMDDFSGFGSPRQIMIENFIEYRGDNDAEFIEADCFKFDISKFKKKFNIYLFDGDHSEESQYKAVKYYLPCLDDTFILVIDDWNWSAVRNGTNRAIRDNNLNVLWKKEIILTKNDEHTPNEEAMKTFWNGIGVFVLKKQ